MTEASYSEAVTESLKEKGASEETIGRWMSIVKSYNSNDRRCTAARLLEATKHALLSLVVGDDANRDNYVKHVSGLDDSKFEESVPTIASYILKHKLI